MRPVVLVTDFGVRDHYAGVLHAVLAERAPGVDRIDLSHEVEPGDVWGASFLLRCAWPYLPSDAVVLAVVDPGVGTGRRAVACRVGSRWLVAPDNGLARAAGHPQDAIELSHETMGLGEPSTTFHGRDLFAPAAAALASGVEATSLGERLDPSDLVACPLPDPDGTAGGWRVTVLHVDRFGNLVTNLGAAEVQGWPALEVPGRARFRLVRTYADAEPGEIVAYAGSSGLVELAIDRDSAAARLGWSVGTGVLVTGAG